MPLKKSYFLVVLVTCFYAATMAMDKKEACCSFLSPDNKNHELAVVTHESNSLFDQLDLNTKHIAYKTNINDAIQHFSKIKSQEQLTILERGIDNAVDYYATNLPISIRRGILCCYKPSFNNPEQLLTTIEAFLGENIQESQMEVKNYLHKKLAVYKDQLHYSLQEKQHRANALNITCGFLSATGVLTFIGGLIYLVISNDPAAGA